MTSFLSSIVLPIAVAAVAVVLLLGLVNMMRGGSPSRSQNLMRLRVLLQFIAIVITMVVGAIGMLLGKVASVLALVWLPVQLVVALGIALIGMPMAYRFVVHDDTMAGIKIGWAISFIMANLGTVLMFFVTVLICGFISGAMGIVPIVGGMFGAAIGQAWNMAAIAQLAKATNNA